jgi:hypothetical protein
MARLQIIFGAGRLDPERPLAFADDLLRALEDDPDVSCISLHAMRPASRRWRRAGDWLLEVEITPEADVPSLLERSALCDLLHDFRQLRLHPYVHILGAP